jgi:small subunit ribosomal protein S21
MESTCFVDVDEDDPSRGAMVVAPKSGCQDKPLTSARPPFRVDEPEAGLLESGAFWQGKRKVRLDNQLGRPLEVEVRDSLEKAMKILKQKMSKEGILQELKRRRFYEKPSVKKKRKTREARKRLRREMKRRVTPAPPR